MGFEDIIDPKTKDIKVNISDAMRISARAVAKKYDEILKNISGMIGMAANAANTELVQKTALTKLEKSSEYGNFKASVHEANDHLNPDTMGGWTQREDMRAAAGGVLNDLIAEEAAKAGIKNVPAPFKTSARKQG